MISVCMATYNGARFIKQQIDSILPQLGADDELIISDDGSTDGTLEIIADYNDARIKILKHSPDKRFSNHEKATANFENALKQAKGDYIFLADQDDIWKENKVSVCVDILKESDFIVHNMSIANEKGEKLKEVLFTKSPLPCHWLSVIIKMKMYGCCMAFNRKCLLSVLPFPKKLIAHDYYILALCLKKYSCAYVDKPLITYRQHIDSVSFNKQNPLLYKIFYRVKLFFQIAIVH